MATKTKKETIEEETKVEETKVEETVENKNDDPEELVDIILPKTKDVKDDVTVWVNERSWTIQRGHHVQVPLCCALQIMHQERMENEAIAFEEFAQGASARHASEVMAGLRNN